MRVFLDSKHLIAMLNDSEPVALSEFGRLLRDGGHSLVLTWSAIAELVPADKNRLVVASRFSALEQTVPLVFLQFAGLLDTEIRIAHEDFTSGSDTYRTYDPYVASFTRMWGRRSDPLMLIDVERHLNLRSMAKQVEMLVAAKPELFTWTHAEAAVAIAAVKREQRDIAAKAAEPLEVTVGERLASIGLRLAQSDVNAFTKLLRRRPQVAPAWRLFVEAFDQIARNVTYNPEVNDVWDLANVSIVPYVGLATLDKNKVAVVRQASRALRHIEPAIDYDRRVEHDMSVVIARLHAAGQPR